jgi:hypothetical protein
MSCPMSPPVEIDNLQKACRTGAVTCKSLRGISTMSQPKDS